LSKYKDSFGKLNEGIHSYRIFDIAILDVGVTILLAGGISLYGDIPFMYTTISLFSLGIILHRLFSVKTTIDKILFQ
jgi:hypothetical protein